ncbi:MAG: LysM peptidoglycan-binding domain-containing protein [Planctomycetes bacterium]|nr:LysM peptidoglycan-binding domain-containing protein [Planctomycetota bacterium]
MFSKSLRLPLFGLLGMAALATAAFYIFSSDSEESDTLSANQPTLEPKQEATEAPEALESIATEFDINTINGFETPLVENEEASAPSAAVETPSETQPAASTTLGQVVEYKIQGGDMVSKIARKFGCKEEDIYRLNDRIDKTNAHKIRAGWTIKVIDNKGVGGKLVENAKAAPSAATPTEVKAETPADTGPAKIERELPIIPEAPAPAEVRVHLFKSGDTPFTLSKQYYGTIKYWALIKNANPHWDMIDSPSGIELKIPALASAKDEVVSNSRGVIPARR